MTRSKYSEFEFMETLPYEPVHRPDRVGPGVTMTKGRRRRPTLIVAAASESDQAHLVASREAGIEERRDASRAFNHRRNSVTAYREEADIIRKHLRSLPDAVAMALGALAESDPVGRKDSAVIARVIQDVLNETLRAISEEYSHVQAA